ncbi:MAG: PEP-CTERM-box response regulator transcription factor [candidate division NC10 bacterium]|nr:PEP-CTERM-box response regulator transcription factor [candidate division NC10 bacterium]
MSIEAADGVVLGQRPRLLVIEDHDGIRSQLLWALTGDYEVEAAGNAAEALEHFERMRPEVVTLDLGLPPDPSGATEGMRLLGEMLRRESRTKVLVVTGNTDQENALSAIRTGAFDYFLKPIELDELRVVLRRAVQIHRLEQENEARERNREADGQFGELLGVSPQMHELFTLIDRVAPSTTTVLITGESGTGKELIARTIHQRSPRRDGPFIPINCGAIPETLLEAELFGHEKGAFTGAHVRRQGRLELAQGGTCFLDEISELSLSLQVKLLRFLQDHQIERIGGRERISLDVRVLAATNADLSRAMAQAKFREDLYFRVSVIVLHVPPLRERPEDILLLASTLFRRLKEEIPGRTLTGFTPEALQALTGHPWPGNVRELENRIRRAVVLSAGPLVTPEDLDLSPSPPELLTLKDARERVERQVVVEALVRAEGNITHAAQEIGVSRPTFHDLLSRHGLDPRQFRA